MSKSDLETLLAKHALSIDGMRAGAGKFRDLEIGVGAPLATLAAFAQEVRAAGHTVTVTRVSNPEHADHGKAYAEVPSFWWDETPSRPLDAVAHLMCEMGESKYGVQVYCTGLGWCDYRYTRTATDAEAVRAALLADDEPWMPSSRAKPELRRTRVIPTGPGYRCGSRRDD